MRRYTYPMLAILVAVGFYLWEKYLDKKEQSDFVKESKAGSKSINFNYLPTSVEENQVVEHAFYTLSYNEKHEQADWVAYELTQEHIVYNDFKRPYFEEDPLVKTNSAHWRNYKKSGYDRGHLCPAADRRFNKKAHDETFFTSNIVPQLNKFNAGIWNDLEKKVRYWVNKEKQLFIVTGPVFKNATKSIGSEGVTVPTHFYKVILKYSGNSSKMIGFLMPHDTTSRKLKQFMVTVDNIETFTGIDFFPELPDVLEEKLESKISKDWRL